MEVSTINPAADVYIIMRMSYYINLGYLLSRYDKETIRSLFISSSSSVQDNRCDNQCFQNLAFEYSVFILIA